jgi:hypothetical protein
VEAISAEGGFLLAVEVTDNTANLPTDVVTRSDEALAVWPANGLAGISHLRLKAIPVHINHECGAAMAHCAEWHGAIKRTHQRRDGPITRSVPDRNVHRRR